MADFSYEYHYLEQVIPLLENYLLSGSLIVPANLSVKKGQPAYPSITPGTILLVFQKGRGLATTAEQARQFDSLFQQFEQITRHWRTKWEQKVGEDYLARMAMWQTFLGELQKKPEENKDRYRYEVGRRVMLELLGDSYIKIAAEQSVNLKLLDRQLQQFFQKGSFIWETNLQSIFPTDKFWYLWGKIS